MVLGDAINGGSYREGDRWESKRKRKKSEGVREKGIEVHSKVGGVDSITRCVCVCSKECLCCKCRRWVEVSLRDGVAKLSS
jgi:hypothetical protein